MASTKEITTIQKIMIKPVAWRILQSPDNSFLLAFTYLQPDKDKWETVETRGGIHKQYKTSDAALKDIARVQTVSTVFCFLNAVT